MPFAARSSGRRRAASAKSPKTTSNVVGTIVLTDMQPKGERWTGKLFIPDDNIHVSAKLQLLDSTRSSSPGAACWGLICRTQIWTRRKDRCRLRQSACVHRQRKLKAPFLPQIRATGVHETVFAYTCSGSQSPLPPAAALPSELEGRWKNGAMEIVIAPCGQSLCGRVVRASAHSR